MSKTLNKPMNKSELVSFIAEKNKCTKMEAEKGLDMTIDGIMDAMREGNNISLVGFGLFGISRREAREGRNPKTGASIKIEAYNQLTFKAGQKLKDACNNS